MIFFYNTFFIEYTHEGIYDTSQSYSIERREYICIAYDKTRYLFRKYKPRAQVDKCNIEKKPEK